jgi:hypothetical protein
MKFVRNQTTVPRFASVVAMNFWEMLHELKLPHDVVALEVI